MSKWIPLVLLAVSLNAWAKLNDDEISEDDLDINIEEEVKAGKWEFKGADITLENRQFADDKDDETYENQRSVLLGLQVYRDLGVGEVKLNFKGRYDDQDNRRNFFWTEDAYIKMTYVDKYTLIAGYQLYNFSNLESFNPLDSINARIFDTSIVNAEKLGELTFGVTTYKYGGNMGFYLLPNPARPILPGKNSRINLAQNLDDPVWMGSKDDEPDWDDHFLITWDGSVGDWDMLLLFHKGIDRSVAIVGTDDYGIVSGSASPNSTKANTPYFFERYLSGVSLTGNWGDDLIKMTAAYSYYLSETEIMTAEQVIQIAETSTALDESELRTPQDNTTISLGYEHPMNHDGGLSSSLILEYQTMQFADGQNTGDFPLANDFFAAWRLDFNDINSKQLTLSGMYDLEGNEEGFVQLDYSQRFKEVFKINVGVLEYMIPDDAAFTGYGIFRDTEHVYLNLTYYL